jgi:uncharacterized protein
METPPDLYVVLYLGRFLSIVYEALPFIVLGAIIAGFLEELVPQRIIANLLPKSHLLAIGLSALLGLAFPMCECGIVPVMRRLLRKGLPLSCCVAYMLAGPIINLVVITSTFVAFAKHDNGYAITVLRVVLGYVVAVVAALIVDWQFRRHGNALLNPIAIPPPVPETVETEQAIRRPISHRLGNITETALHDFTDIMLFLILGSALAAAVGLFVDRAYLDDLSRNYPVVAIAAMMGAAILLCLCSEADAFVAASFTTLLPAAKLSFLVLGPMLDIKLFLMYTRVFRFRLIWTIIPAVAIQVLLYTLLVHYAFEAGWLTEFDARLRGLFGPSGPASP